MNTVVKSKLFIGVVLVAILISIPLTLSLITQQQEIRSRASASTTLSFSPNSSTSTPIQKNVGDTIDLDMYVDPGNSMITFVKYQVSFDPSKVQLVSAKPVDLNSTIFSNVEGPVLNTGNVAESVSIGSDPTKAITQRTKIGTLHFTAVGGTSGGTTTISYSTISQTLSSATTDQASQNVLSTTTPAFISIAGSGSPNPTTIPIPTITGTALNFTLLLHGIGAAGDNPNPGGNTLSNKNPLHPQRVLTVSVFDTNNQIVASSSSPVTFNSNSGMFEGAVGLPSTLPSGNYSVKIQTNQYLRKLIPGIQQIVSGQTNPIPQVQLIAGDTNDDNVLNVLDYNALLDCGYGQLNPLPMNDPNSAFNTKVCQAHSPAENVDLNDDGMINSTDYNLFLRELSVQSGD